MLSGCGAELLALRRIEQLFDVSKAVRLGSEIFSLVSYIEHVFYARLNPAHGAPPAIRDCTAPA